MANPLSFEEPKVPMTPTKSSGAAPTSTTTKRVAAVEKVPTKIPARKTAQGNREISSKNKKNQKRRIKGHSRPRNWDGYLSGLLAIGIYALMHDSGIMTILLLAFVWWYSLEENHQRIFLFFLVILNFAEYFYLLPPVLARYQQEDWWDVPTIKTALLTMTIFWSIAWFSAYTGSYLENKEQRLRLEKEKRRLEQQAMFQQYTAKPSPPTSNS